MVQILEDGEGLLDEFVRWSSFDVHHEPDATGIMLEFGIIQALFRGKAKSSWMSFSYYHTTFPQWKHFLAPNMYYVTDAYDTGGMYRGYSLQAAPRYTTPVRPLWRSRGIVSSLNFNVPIGSTVRASKRLRPSPRAGSRVFMTSWATWAILRIHPLSAGTFPLPRLRLALMCRRDVYAASRVEFFSPS